MAYSLSCGHQQNLRLKTKQEEALFHLYNDWGGYVPSVFKLATESQLATNYVSLQTDANQCSTS